MENAKSIIWFDKVYGLVDKVYGLVDKVHGFVDKVHGFVEARGPGQAQAQALSTNPYTLSTNPYTLSNQIMDLAFSALGTLTGIWTLKNGHVFGLFFWLLA